MYARPIEAADLEVWAGYLQDPQVYEHTSWNPTSPTELEKYLWTNQSHAADSLLRLALACSETKPFGGYVRLSHG